MDSIMALPFSKSSLRMKLLLAFSTVSIISPVLCNEANAQQSDGFMGQRAQNQTYPGGAGGGRVREFIKQRLSTGSASGGTTKTDPFDRLPSLRNRTNTGIFDRANSQTPSAGTYVQTRPSYSWVGKPDGSKIGRTPEKISLEKKIWDAFELANAERSTVVSSSRQKAISICEQVIANNPRIAMAYYIRGWCRLESNQLSGAISDFSESMKLSPNPKLYMLRGLAYYRNGRYEQAISDYRNGGNGELVYSSIGLCKLKLHDPTGAADDFTRAIDLQRGYAGRLYVYLKEAHEQLQERTDGDLARARQYGGSSITTHGDRLQDLDAELRFSSNNAYLYADRASVLAALGQYPAAISDFDRANQLGRGAFLRERAQTAAEYGTEKLRLASVLASGSEDRSGIEASRTKEKARVALIYSATAEKCIKSGQYAYAVQYLDKAIGSNPSDASFYQMRADACVKLGRDAQALKDYSQAITLRSTDANLYTKRAHFYESKGKLNEAVSDYTQAMKYSRTQDLDVLNRCVQLMTKTGNYQGAIENCKKILKQSPNDVKILALQAQLLESSGQFDLALQNFDLMKKISPQDPSIVKQELALLDRLCSVKAPQSDHLARRARLLEKSGQTEKALADLTLAQKQNPDADYSGKIAQLTNKTVAKAAAEKPKQKLTADEEIAQLTEKVNANPEDHQSRFRRAKLFIKINQLQKAKADLDFLISEEFNAYTERGRVCFDLGLFKDALTDYDQAIKLAPTEGALYMRRAGVHKKLGNLEGAQHDLEEARRLHYEDP